jgi:hypothetical protein
MTKMHRRSRRTTNIGRASGKEVLQHRPRGTTECTDISRGRGRGRWIRYKRTILAELCDWLRFDDATRGGSMRVPGPLPRTSGCVKPFFIVQAQLQ